MGFSCVVWLLWGVHCVGHRAVAHDDDARAHGRCSSAPSDAVQRTEESFEPLPFLGMSTSGEASSELSGMLKALRSAGAGTLRLSFSWADMEPTRQRFRYAWHDSATAQVRSAGIEPTGILLTSPPWAVGGAAEPMTMTTSHVGAWADFVQRTVARYESRVRYWEVWNEPNAPLFNRGQHSPAHYAKLASQACRAAKRAAPMAQVGIGVANFDLRYLRLVVRAMQQEEGCFDFIAVHPYELLDSLRFPCGAAQFLQIVPHLRAMLREVAPDKVGVPIWFSEIGHALPERRSSAANVSSAASERQVSDLLIKGYALSLAQGIEHMQWFELKDAGGSQGHGLLDDDLRKRHAYGTFRALTTTFGARATYVGWVAFGSEGRGFLYKRAEDGRHVLVAWLPPGQEFSWSPPVSSEPVIAGSSAGDASTLRLTGSPTLLLLPRDGARGVASLIREARRNRHRTPLGRRLDSWAARIELGDHVQSQGLHLLAPRSTQTHSFDDGSSGAVLREGVRSYRFAVDPPLNRYQHRRFCVSVEARALRPHPQGRYAGMNLLYQPVEGRAHQRPAYPYANLMQWYSLPDNGRWHTHRWCVQGAMMVHTFGYGFALSVDDSVPFALGEVRLMLPPSVEQSQPWPVVQED